MVLISDKMGWMIAKSWAELLRSAKHILRNGMPDATEEEVVKLVEAARTELLDNNYHAYYKM